MNRARRTAQLQNTGKVRQALTELGKLGPVWNRDLAARAGLPCGTVANILTHGVRSGWARKVAYGWYEPTDRTTGVGSNARDVARQVREYLEEHAPHGTDPEQALTARQVATALGRDARNVRKVLTLGCADPDGGAWAVRVKVPAAPGRRGIEPVRYTAAAEGDDGKGTYIPTQARIHLECLKIQKTWTPEDYGRRTVQRADELTIPGAGLPAWFDRSYLYTPQETASRESHL